MRSPDRTRRNLHANQSAVRPARPAIDLVYVLPVICYACVSSRVKTRG